MSRQQHGHTPCQDVDDVVVVHDIDGDAVGRVVIVVDDDEGNAVHHTPINPSKVRNTEFCFVSETQIVPTTTPAGQIGMLMSWRMISSQY